MQNNPSLPLFFLCSFFRSFSNRFYYPPLLTALTSDPFSFLCTHSFSLYTKQRTTRCPTSCHFPTYIRHISSPVSRVIKHFCSIPLILFAFKQIISPQAQTYPTLTIQVSQFVLSHYATRFTPILAPHPPITGWASHLRTAVWFLFALATASKSCSAIPSFVLRLVSYRRTALARLAVLSLAAFTSNCTSFPLLTAARQLSFMAPLFLL